MGDIHVVEEQTGYVINFDNVKAKTKLAEVGKLKGLGRRGEGKERRSSDGLISQSKHPTCCLTLRE